MAARHWHKLGLAAWGFDSLLSIVADAGTSSLLHPIVLTLLGFRALKVRVYSVSQLILGRGIA